MPLSVTALKDDSIRLTALHGRIVLPNQARNVWNLDELEWDAKSFAMGDNAVKITIKSGPNSPVRLEFYIERVKGGSSLPVEVVATLVFCSDIPEFDNGNIYYRSEVVSGSFNVASIGTKRTRGHNAGLFDLEFNGQSPVRGTYFVKKMSGKNAV